MTDRAPLAAPERDLVLDALVDWLLGRHLAGDAKIEFGADCTQVSIAIEGRGAWRYQSADEREMRAYFERAIMERVAAIEAASERAKEET